jgi:aspartokinase
MTKYITNGWISDDVVLVTIKKLPSDIGTIAGVFEALAAKDINVDMISQSPPGDSSADISFTVSEEDLSKTLEMLALFQKKSKEIKMDVNAGNTKIALYGDAMKNKPGVAASVFRTLAGTEIEVKLITTSEADISVLINSQDADKVTGKLAEVFDVQF